MLCAGFCAEDGMLQARIAKAAKDTRDFIPQRFYIEQDAERDI
jgi:hypothetical protein